MHWGVRQNKLETPKDKDEVNKQYIHECDGWAHDPDTMVSPLTPKPEFVYYESLIEESTRLTYTLLYVELEHLKIETRLINTTSVSEMGEYVRELLLFIMSR